MRSLPYSLNDILVWHVAASDKLSVLVKSRVSVLVEVYLLGLSYADSVGVLTRRGGSIGVEVVRDLLVSTFFLLWSFS